jgi:uncharacterized protein
MEQIKSTGRPARSAIMRQKWRELTFVHWRFPPEAVRPLVPPDLELDLFDGAAYVGLVFFTMTGVRPVFVPPIIGLSSFHETNVRTYVRLADHDPGVWFYSLDAASSPAVRSARTFFYLPYHRAQMFLDREPANDAGQSSGIVYAGVRRWPAPVPASYALRATTVGRTETAQPGTLEHFLIERYILYTLGRGHLYQGRVYHRPYPIQTAQILSLDETLLAAAGFRRPDAEPLAHYSPGVDVEVFALRHISPTRQRGSGDQIAGG